MRIAWLLVVMGLQGSAAADTKVLQFSRSTPLPASARQLPDQIAHAIGAAVAAQVSDESLVTLHCDESDSCLADVAHQLGASELIFGTIRSGVRHDNKLVTIVRFVPGVGRTQETFLIELDADAPRVLVHEAKGFLETPLRVREPREPPEPNVSHEPNGSHEAGDQRVPTEPQASEPAREEPRRVEVDDLVVAEGPRRRISTGTYALLGGGGATLGLGIGITLHAWSLRTDVARAPVDTAEDLRRLAALEQRGRTFTTAGAVLTIGGAAVIVYGAVRAWRERRTSDSALVLVPTRDGAALAFTRSW